MVQLSLRKAGILAGLLTLALLVGAFLVLFTDVGHHGLALDARRRWPDPVDKTEWTRQFPPRPAYILDPALKTELKRIYADIAVAYSNEQVEVLREWRRKLPEMVESINQNDFDDIERPIDRIMYDELYRKAGKVLGEESIGEEYRGVEDFERHVSAFLALAHLYGDVRHHRRDYRGMFDSLEAGVFFRLKSYRNSFHAEGRVEMEKAAERAIGKWIDQIESENGYTRASVVRGIAFVRMNGNYLMDELSKTWEEISQNPVLQYTHLLIRAGYTPKWLEEFKNIPRHAAPRNVSPKE